jgi:hypothetical protein
MRKKERTKETDQTIVSAGRKNQGKTEQIKSIQSKSVST